MRNLKRHFIGLCCVIFLILNLLGYRLVQALKQRVYEPLSGVVIVLDAGHGGKDLGASDGGVNEAEINLKIVNKLADLLKEAGVNVLYTRKDENDLSSKQAKNHKKEDMKNRVAIINDEKCDLFISIHLNSYADSRVQGAQVFYQRGREESEGLAFHVQKAFKKNLQSKLEIKKGNYYILNKARIPGILVECGFISNDSERKRLNNDGYQQQIADAIFSGILQYFDTLNYN